MKTRSLSFFLILFVFSIESYASHYMGGEITWQCLGNGNYRFVMKLYRECNGITYNNNETMTITNYPALTSVTMTLKPGGNPHDIDDGLLDGKTDLSPGCWNSSLAIHCNPNPDSANTGAVQEWYFTSDVSYPNGVQLIGAPPAAGWIFSYTSCCRNPSSNLISPTSASWFIRAIMYPYNGLNAFPCYNGSPVFAESPATAICNGTPYTYQIVVNDPENDSLSYSWAPALNGNISTPVGYVPNFSANCPMPSFLLNPMNVAASLDSLTGQLSYQSFTNGAFVTVVKVTEFRNGIKIGEVFREYQYVILPCSGNNPPIIEEPIYNPVSGLWESTDTVDVGDIVDFDVMASDFDLLPNSNNQTITMHAAGFEFGAGFSNPTTGCPYPPCATLNPPPIFSGLFAIATHFHWQTSCSHMINYVVDNNYAYSTHDFYFQVSDNACAVPGEAYKNVKVVIRQPLVNINAAVSYATNTYILLTWNNQAWYGGKYYIYRAVNSGPFALIDSTWGSPYVDNFNNNGLLCEYKIRINDSSLCDSWSAVCSNVNWLGIEDYMENSRCSVFPNPANQNLFVGMQASVAGSAEVSVFNAQGQEVYRHVWAVVPDNNEFVISSASWPAGIYFVKVSAENRNTVFKVSVLH